MSVNFSEHGASDVAELLIERRVGVEAGLRAPRLLNGSGAPVWAVLEAAVEQGLDTRIGLEDTLKLPDGSVASGNAELVAAAVEIARR